MKIYDLVVVGEDLYALTVALFLSRKMRKVLVLQDSHQSNDYEKIRLSFADKKFSLAYNRNNVVSGLDESGLLYAYLDNLGLVKSLSYEKTEENTLINQNSDFHKQLNSLEGFRIYLVRHYPKNIKEIDNFFEILKKHYVNYKEQFLNMLINTEYTLSSLMIEWGDYSLEELLIKYFSSDNLIKEFTYNNFISGLPIEEVNAYSFFSNYFLGLESGFYLLNNSYKDICLKSIEKINLVNPKAFSATSVKEFVVKDKKIECIIDSQNNLIYAKYFFVSGNPIDFYEKYFDISNKDMELLNLYYPNINSDHKISTLYLALNTKLSDIGIEDLIYYFKNDNLNSTKLIRMYNYSKSINQDLRKKEGLLCIDFTYVGEVVPSKEDLLKLIDVYIPKLRKFVGDLKIGKSSKYLSMLRDSKLRRNLSINEMINVETFEHIQVFENLFIGGDFIRPEAGFFGAINQSIIYADKIEDKLYYGDNTDDFEYFSNDEIMMMIRHNYDFQKLDSKEIHINFHIGKSNYYIRTKGKNIIVHHGRYNNSDLSIYTTNDKLSDLLLKKTSFKSVLESGSLKYRGDLELLYKAVDAFKLDDYQEFVQEEYLTSKYKYFGVKLFFMHLFIYSVASLLSNYYPNIYIFPIAFCLSIVVSIIKYQTYEHISWFEIVLNSGLLIASVLSIFLAKFNNLYSDDIFLGFIILVFLTSVIINQPIVYLYHRYDMKADYRNTKLFKIITNGLTFIWGFIFLVILGGTYLVGNSYVTMFYSFLFFGILLTYFYPIIYVRTSIKK
ncbi:MAG: hypothetical protein CVV60_03695 [Tenericutes bacterium HGW-Tenericutes-5]|nr:MAG: hypothetical protein CVV60_03695 [Tenericutes bacterium HGW-Tenericutes-5]